MSQAGRALSGRAPTVAAATFAARQVVGARGRRGPGAVSSELSDNEFVSTDSEDDEGTANGFAPPGSARRGERRRNGVSAAAEPGPEAEAAPGLEQVAWALDILDEATGGEVGEELISLVVDSLSAAGSPAADELLRTPRGALLLAASSRAERSAEAMEGSAPAGVEDADAEDGAGGSDGEGGAAAALRGSLGATRRFEVDREGDFICPRNLGEATLLVRQPDGSVAARRFRGCVRPWAAALEMAKAHRDRLLLHPGRGAFLHVPIDSLELGPGLELHFWALRWGGALFAALSLLAAGAIAINLVVQYRSQTCATCSNGPFGYGADIFAQTTLGVHAALTRQERYTYFGFARDEVLFVLSLADLTGALLLLAALLVAAARLDGRLAARRRTLRGVSLGMFTVKVKGLPDIEATPALADEVQAHFERLYGTGAVAEVALSTARAGLVPLFEARAVAKAARRRFSALVNASRGARWRRAREAAAEAVEAANVVIAPLLDAAEGSATSIAFVTFTTTELRAKCLADHQSALRSVACCAPPRFCRPPPSSQPPPCFVCIHHKTRVGSPLRGSPTPMQPSIASLPFAACASASGTRSLWHPPASHLM